MKKILHTLSIILVVITGLWLQLCILSLFSEIKNDLTLLISLFIFAVLPLLASLWLFKVTKPTEAKEGKSEERYDATTYIPREVVAQALPEEIVQDVCEDKQSEELVVEAPEPKEVETQKIPCPVQEEALAEEQEKLYDFTCIDFETANNELNSACSIGLVAVKDLKIVKEEYFLIKTPTSYFNPKNTEIHGITYDMVKNEPSFEELWENLKHYFLASHYMAAHNARFDMSVLYQAAAVYGLEIPNFTYLDSITFSSKVRDSKNSLEACAEYFGIDLGVHHNALDDARTCAQIMIAAVNKSRFKTIHSYLKGYSSINPKEYCNLKPQKNFASKFSDATTTGITSTKSNFDTSHPFYGKSIVLTGELGSMTRSIAMQKIADVGGLLKGSVSTRTDYLIVGEQNPSIVDDTGMSTKEKKAYALQEDGCDIKIIDEQEFLDLL